LVVESNLNFFTILIFQIISSFFFLEKVEKVGNFEKLNFHNKRNPKRSFVKMKGLLFYGMLLCIDFIFAVSLRAVIMEKVQLVDPEAQATTTSSPTLNSSVQDVVENIKNIMNTKNATLGEVIKEIIDTIGKTLPENEEHATTPPSSLATGETIQNFTTLSPTTTTTPTTTTPTPSEVPLGTSPPTAPPTEATTQHVDLTSPPTTSTPTVLVSETATVSPTPAITEQITSPPTTTSLVVQNTASPTTTTTSEVMTPPPTPNASSTT
jgi:hypothetical protein